MEPFGHTPQPHHLFLISELEAVARGETRRLMINMPPGSAKSTYGTILFGSWFLAQRPNLDIIQASNTANLAERFSRRVMGFVRAHSLTLGYDLTRESAEEWTTTTGGQYRAAGVGGAIAGTRADLVIIDDPVRTRQEADSATVRETQWNWFTSDLRSRLKPEAPIVIIMTRWHEDDLGGRLLHRQKGLWRTLSLPAVAEKNDPLGRSVGEWLWDADEDYAYGDELRRVYAECQASGAMRDWAALYQQRPRPAEGAIFKPHLIEVLDAAPRCVSVTRAWDLAATRDIGTNDPDWTVGIKMGRTENGRYFLLDVVRLRGTPDEIEAAVVNTAGVDGKGVKIRLPEDPGQAGKQQSLYYAKKLAGYQFVMERESGDKATRASPFAAQVNAGNVSMHKAFWNAAYTDELAAFPSGAHDDQVDASSGAFAQVGLTAAPIKISGDAVTRFARR